MSDIIDVDTLKRTLREFAREREWSKFHSPKNIAMALACETGELLEILQWMTEQDSLLIKEDLALKEKISHELADILLYIVQMADVLAIPLNQAIKQKIQLNRLKYPT
ncbi:MAG: nucleotide pyrophosphohydrolase [Gammaproteobacteria bacterium]|nr:nucleotide pyrophosphohydrolase [Gammaproteobacteria bacterium]